MTAFRENYASILFWLCVYLFFCTFMSIEAWNSGTPSPVLEFFGYSKWFIRNSPDPIWVYLLNRPWHIVPMVISVVSFMFVSKVLITGKCSFLKGIELRDIVFINTVITGVFVAPMAIEIVLTPTIVFGTLAVCLVYLEKIVLAISTRFDSACSCDNTEAKNIEGYTENSKETAYTTKKYPQGR